eukprot:Colp12_sorted_trinity150504_noHs@7385
METNRHVSLLKLKQQRRRLRKKLLDAIEKNLYGWFWVCPNGGDKCHYRHALPPGYVLKRDKKKMEEQAETITLEELIETERAALATKGTLTPVTFESFLAWKEKKRLEKAKEEKAKEKKRAADFKAGVGTISGRELFSFRPELFVDDEDATDEKYIKDEDLANQQETRVTEDLEVDEELFDEANIADLDIEDVEDDEEVDE